jgi:outer membrane murein-binding lipoprotein Lpp
MMRRRMGRALVAGAVVGGVAHHAGRVSAENDAREQQQSAQIADLQAQQDQMAQQQMAQQPQYAPPPPQYAPPPPQYAPPPPQYAPVEAPPAAPAPTPAQPDRIAQLKELGELKAAGVLTEEEFQAEKAKILNS